MSDDDDYEYDQVEDEDQFEKDPQEEPIEIHTSPSKELPLSVDQDQNLDDNQKLRKWKELLQKHIENVSRLRAYNHKLRNDLKRLGDKAEKLVQSNVRRQKLLEQKSDSKHSYMNEQKIVSLIMKKTKTIQDFKDKIDPKILDKLIEIQNKQISNQTMREQIKALKDRNKNLDQVDQINHLTNQLKHLQTQLKAQKIEEEELERIIKKSEIELTKQSINCDYGNRKETLQSQIKDTKEIIKLQQKQEQANSRKEIEQNQVYVLLQKLYRDACKAMNVRCEDQKFLTREKESQPSKDLAKEIFEQNQQVYLKLQKAKDSEEKVDEKQKIIDEYKQNPENKFKEAQQRVLEMMKKLEEIEKSTSKELKNKQEDIVKINEENHQLQKQLKEKEFETRSVITKLNEIQRTLSLIERKVQEPQQSSQFKPEMLVFGIESNTETQLPFDDAKNLDWGFNLPIKKIVVCVNQVQLIIGLELYYGYEADQKVTKHIGSEVEPKEKIEITLDEDDKLSHITGYYNQEQIIFLKFETMKRKQQQVGNMKFKDQLTKDFRVDIKDREVVGFNGILDYTSESHTPQERFLVAIGVTLKQKEGEIRLRKQLKKQLQEEEKEKQRVPLDYRKIHYPFKKNAPKNLELIKSQPALDLSVQDIDKMKQINKERERYLKAKLGLNSAKFYHPATYKQEEYKKEEQERREKSEQRRKNVEKKRVELSSGNLLPLIDKKAIAAIKIQQEQKSIPQQKPVSTTQQSPPKKKK